MNTLKNNEVYVLQCVHISCIVSLILENIELLISASYIVGVTAPRFQPKNLQNSFQCRKHTMPNFVEFSSWSSHNRKHDSLIWDAIAHRRGRMQEDRTTKTEAGQFSSNNKFQTWRWWWLYRSKHVMWCDVAQLLESFIGRRVAR
jgi:hypothetical protein